MMTVTKTLGKQIDIKNRMVLKIEQYREKIEKDKLDDFNRLISDLKDSINKHEEAIKILNNYEK